MATISAAASLASSIYSIVTAISAAISAARVATESSATTSLGETHKQTESADASFEGHLCRGLGGTNLAAAPDSHLVDSPAISQGFPLIYNVTQLRGQLLQGDGLLLEIGMSVVDGLHALWDMTKHKLGYNVPHVSRRHKRAS